MMDIRAPRLAAMLLATTALSACKNLDVPDYYAGSIDELTSGHASPTSVKTAAQGLPIGTRNVISGIVITWGEVGREGYSLDPANPENQKRRLVTEDRSIASGTWSTGYANLRQENIILKALDGVSGLSDAEKEGIRGWTKTLMAVDYLILTDVFDQSGISLDVDRAVNDPLAPIATKAEAYTRILQLLDQAKVHLQAGGTAFAFLPGPGYTGFSTPATFLKVNRAIRARVDVYMQNWATALTDLNESFLDTNGAMSLGAYNAYSSRSGDATNPLYDPVPRTQVAHQSVITEAQKRADGTPDLRATSKTAVITTRVTNGVTVDRKFTIYQTNADPIPIIKNEELILLRAEANFQLGNRATALADINVVRTKSGGLPALTADPGNPGMRDEILYNRRYSLMWEGAHRWLDMRRYGLLAQLPKYAPDHVVYPYAPLPDAECIGGVRDPVPAGCTVPIPIK
jgi:hypothetical protein